jgi:hypothetical protein
VRNSTGHQPAVGPAFRPSNGAHLFFCSSRLRHALAVEDQEGLSSDSGIHWDVHRGRACACGERAEARGNPSPRGRPGRCFAGRRPPARALGRAGEGGRIPSVAMRSSSIKPTRSHVPAPGGSPRAQSRPESPSEASGRACMLLARLPLAVAAASGERQDLQGKKSGCLPDRFFT